MLSEELKQNLRALIAETAAHFGITYSFAETGLWDVMLLREIRLLSPDIVFKGGTSLSKCHKVIRRFSEDVDLSLAKPHYSVGQRRKIAHGISDVIVGSGLTLVNPGYIRSRRILNRYLIRTPDFSSTSPNGTSIILELALQTPAYPVETKSIQTMVGEYLAEEGEDELVRAYGLEPFEVRTLKIERTFVDKTFAICDYHLSGRLTRTSRHIYDLHSLLPLITLDDDLVDLYKSVSDYRLLLPSCYAVQSDLPLSTLIHQIVEEGTFRADYRQWTVPMLFEGVSYEDCIPAIMRIADFLSEHGM